jgi:hypothetical protein
MLRALLAAVVLLLLSAVSSTSPVTSKMGLTLDLYTNGAMAGSPARTVTIRSLDNISLPAGSAPFSAEITGTVLLLRNESYVFRCTGSQAITILMLHIGDHLVCQRGTAGDLGTMQQFNRRVVALSADTLVFRWSAYGNGTASAGNNWAAVQWSTAARGSAADASKFGGSGAGGAAEQSVPVSAVAASASARKGNRIHHGYTRWPIQNIDTIHNLPCPSPGCSEPPGVSDNSSQTLAGCVALCEALVSKGCIGFVSHFHTWMNGTENETGLCYLRGTAPNCPAGNCVPKPGATCASVFSPTQSRSCGGAVWTRDATCEAGFAKHPPPKPFPQGSCPKPPPPSPPLGPTEPIDASRLSPTLPVSESARRVAQNRLRASGWASWYNMDTLRLVRLPEGISLRFGLCDALNCTAPQTLDGRRPSRARLRAGIHAYDRSYSQLYFTDGRSGVNISIEVSGGQNLQLRASRVGSSLGSADGVDSGPVTLFIEALTTWRFANDLAATANGTALRLNSPGSSTVNATLIELDGQASSGGGAARFAGLSPIHVIVELSAVGTVARFSTTVGMTAGTLDAHMEAMRKAELHSYNRFGALATIAQAAQAAVMWNVKYNPVEYGPFSPPAPWDFVTQGAHPDFGYTLFDWDNLFAAYLLGLGASTESKTLAYSCLIQIIKAKTTEGFVPNANTISDRSEPPIGSKVLLELFRKHGDGWIVRLLFDDLLDWQDWFLQRRQLKPLQMIALGSVGGMDPSRLESGCDDSPMCE